MIPTSSMLNADLFWLGALNILLLAGELYIFGAVKLRMLLNRKIAQQILIKALACIMFGLACTILFPKVYKLFL